MIIEKEKNENLAAKGTVAVDSTGCSVAVCPKPQEDLEVTNNNKETTLAVMNPHTSNGLLLIHVSSENEAIQKPVVCNEVKELEIRRFQVFNDHCYYAHKQEHTGSANSQTEDEILLIHSSSNRKIIQKDEKSSNSKKPVVSLQSLKRACKINDHNQGISDCTRKIDGIKKLKITEHVQRTDGHYSYTSEHKNTGSVDSQTASRTLLVHPSYDNRIIQKDGTSSNDEKKILSQQLIECVQEMEDHNQEMVDDTRETGDHMQKVDDYCQKMAGDTRETEIDAREMKDHTQEIECHRQEMVNYTQEMEDLTQKVIDSCQKMTGDTREIDDAAIEMESHTQEIDDRSQEMLGDTREMEDDASEVKDHIQETEGHSQEIDDTREMEGQTQEIEDHSQETAEIIEDDARELESHVQEIEDHVLEIEDRSQETADDTWKVIEAVAREMEDQNQKILDIIRKIKDYTQKMEDSCQTMADSIRKMEDDARKVEDHTQEMESSCQKTAYNTREMEDDARKVEDHCQKMANGTREREGYAQETEDLCQETEYNARQMEDHSLKIKEDHVQEMIDHSRCTLAYDGVEGTHSECKNKSMLSRSENGAVQRKKISSKVQRHGQLLQSANHSQNTENVSNSTFSHDCAPTYSTNSQGTVNPGVKNYVVSVAKMYEELQMKKSPSAYDKAVKYSYKLFKFMNTLKYPDLDYVCAEICSYFKIFWWESPTERFPASSDFKNVLRLDEQAFVRGAELTLLEGLKIQSIVSRFLDYILYLNRVHNLDIMHLKSIVRIYAALCKQINDKVKFRALILAILMTWDGTALYVVAIIASIWPEVLQETINGEARDHILVKVISYALFTKPAELDDDLWNYCVYVFKTLCKLSTSLDYKLQFLLDKLFSELTDHEMSLSPFEADKSFLTSLFILIRRHGWERAMQHIIIPYLVEPIESLIEKPRILALHFTIFADLAVKFNKSEEMLDIVEKLRANPLVKTSSDLVDFSGFLAADRIKSKLSEKPILPKRSTKTASE